MGSIEIANVGIALGYPEAIFQLIEFVDILADAVEALRQDVKQETPDELVGGKDHRAIPRLPVAAIILVAEGDTAFVECHETAVRDGDAARFSEVCGAVDSAGPLIMRFQP